MTVFAALMIGLAACNQQSNSGSVSGESGASVEKASPAVDAESGTPDVSESKSTETPNIAEEQPAPEVEKPGVTGDAEKDVKAMVDYVVSESKKVKTPEEAKKLLNEFQRLDMVIKSAYKGNSAEINKGRRVAMASEEVVKKVVKDLRELAAK